MNEIELPQDQRARRLFDELERRFSHYVNGLPGSLKEVASAKSTYLGADAEGEFKGIVSLNPVLAGTPWLFWEQFSDLEEGAFVDIAEAGACLVTASILLDHLVDGQAEPAEQTALFHQSLRSHAFRTYQSVFSSESPFWELFYQLESDHILGLGLEVQAQTMRAPVTWEILEQTAHGKVSPIICTIAAMTNASDRPELMDPIERSLRHIAVASQLLDDIGDWRHDQQAGHQTHFLSEIRSRVDGQPADPSLEALQAIIDDSWLDVDHLHMVIEHLERSLSALEEPSCMGWRDYVTGYIALAEGHQARAVATHLKQKLNLAVPEKKYTGHR